VLLFLVAIAIGVGVHYSVLFGLATVAFWIVRAQGLIYGYFNLFNIGRYPDVVFHGIFKVIFSFTIPIILVANVPVRALTGHLDHAGHLVLLLALASAFVVTCTRAFWKHALRRYSSASS
jgi:ABC-2 type transport system permease protein